MKSLKRSIYQSVCAQQEHNPKRAKVSNFTDIENVDPNRMHIEQQESKNNLSLDVSSMRVVELRQELRKRDLDTKGLKKDLQKRLRTALETECEVVQNGNSKNMELQNAILHQTEIGKTVTEELLPTTAKENLTAAGHINSGNGTNGNLTNHPIDHNMNAQSIIVENEMNHDEMSMEARKMSSDVSLQHPNCVNMPALLEQSPIPKTISVVSNTNAQDPTIKDIELSIEDLTKLRVDSCAKQRPQDSQMEDGKSREPLSSLKKRTKQITNMDEEMRDHTEDVYSNATPSSSKKGPV